MPSLRSGVTWMIIGVTGGKGGTGKTVFAVNLAVALAGTGKKVTLIDCDPDCPSAHIILGATLRGKRNVSMFIPVFDNKKCKKCGECVKTCEPHAIFQVKGSTPVLFDKICTGCKTCLLACKNSAIKHGRKTIGWTYHTRRHGVELYSGELKPSEPLSEKIVEAVKNRGMGKNEVTIIDTAAGAHCNVVKALEGCENAFLITEPTLFGIHDLEVIKKVLKKMGITHEVVLNRSDVSSKKPKASMEIPYDKTMITCYVDGTPIVEKHPEHAISKKFLYLAKRLNA